MPKTFHQIIEQAWTDCSDSQEVIGYLANQVLRTTELLSQARQELRHVVVDLEDAKRELALSEEDRETNKAARVHELWNS